jgi:hypothetical protein
MVAHRIWRTQGTAKRQLQAWPYTAKAASRTRIHEEDSTKRLAGRCDIIRNKTLLFCPHIRIGRGAE